MSISFGNGDDVIFTGKNGIEDTCDNDDIDNSAVITKDDNDVTANINFTASATTITTTTTNVDGNVVIMIMVI